MGERLVIRNFGPIKEADLDLRRFSLLIGTQASGKSTIAKLLAIFRDFEFIIEGDKDYRKKFVDYNIVNFFSEETYFEYSSPDYKISFINEKFEIKKERAFLEKISIERTRVEKFLSDFIKGRADLSSAAKDDEATYLKRMYEANWKDLFSVSVEPTYIPAERMLLSLVTENPFSLFKNFALPTCITNFGLRYEQAKRIFPEVAVDFLNITFKVEDGKQKVYFGDVSLDLSECASGFQAIIPIILVLKGVTRAKTSASFIIEEPELSLFPTTQKHLINFLVGSLNSRSAQGGLVLTTHSPYILSALNILLFAFITGHSNSEKIEKLNNIVPQNSWINPDDFNAFYLSDGKVSEIFDRKVNLISENELDGISEDIQGKFDEIMEIYKEK